MFEPAAPSSRNEARRDQILKAAMKCFRENGFHGSSVAELAKHAGMSVGHIYHYFENKDAIIEAIVDRDVAETMGILDEFSRAPDAVAAILDQVDAPVGRSLNSCRATVRLEVMAEAARNPRIAAKLQAADTAARRRLAEVVAKSPSLAGCGAEDIDWRVEAIFGVFDGLMLRGLHQPTLDRDGATRAIRLALHALLTAPTQ